MDFFAPAQELGFTIPDLSQKASYYPHSFCLCLEGRTISEHFCTQARLLAAGRPVPCLAVILVGDNPASLVYVNHKAKTFHKVGFKSRIHHLAAPCTSTETLVTLIETLNGDPLVHGILVQLPLPVHVDADLVLGKISSKKDVDGFLPKSLGALVRNHPKKHLLPCTPLGIMAMLQAYGFSYKGRHAVVVGRSTLVGRPLGLLLLNADATVTLAHSKTLNLDQLTKQADMLFVAAGQQELITKSHVKAGAVVIDVGIHKTPSGRLCGDVHPEVKTVASALSPVPGGVGPMTIAMLLVNTAVAAWSP